jgi:hypothetical protein
VRRAYKKENKIVKKCEKKGLGFAAKNMKFEDENSSSMKLVCLVITNNDFLCVCVCVCVCNGVINYVIKNLKADPSDRAIWTQVCRLSLVGIAGSNPAGDIAACPL